MKTIFALCMIVFFANSLTHAQDKLLADLDNDTIKDTVYLDTANATIVCRLSTHAFKILASKPIETLNEQAGITLTNNGFAFFNDWMRAGYKNQFRYNPLAKNIQLIGMSRYEFGNATNDGSGESSVNLLTNNYIGKWNYYDEVKNTLVEIPAIKTKMPIKTTYLSDFSENTYFDYAEKCAALFEKRKAAMLKKARG